MALAIRVRFSMLIPFAVCPGGEEAVLKTVGRKRFAGSNPVCGAIFIYDQVVKLA